jgi:GNAT superfamily N-acetyltransferase
MKIDHPETEQIPQLRQLWKDAFCDTDNFLDKFYVVAFSSDRSLCATVGCEVAAMAYWFDCGEYAYIYAVATAEKHRGKGICHALMARLHDILIQRGYAGCILVPGDERLRQFYRGMGYENCGGVREFDCEAGTPLALQQLNIAEYGAQRRRYLPEDGVLQEGIHLEFLSSWASFYAGEDVLAVAAWEDGKLRVLELLGDAEKAPGVVAALGAKSGWFRTPGDNPFGMHKVLNSETAPKYFGFCF